VDSSDVRGEDSIIEEKEKTKRKKGEEPEKKARKS